MTGRNVRRFAPAVLVAAGALWMACSKSSPRPLPAPAPQRPEIDTVPHMPGEMARDTVPRDTTTPMPHALPV
ncbi:MAG TPA: hypothetical protein VNB89_03935, partial [Gemmatimonadaceae bacterium]|nr:hypothetical protein [Gemmatimonadaceae bacterium]